jgi:hypothetical protein
MAIAVKRTVAVGRVRPVGAAQRLLVLPVDAAAVAVDAFADGFAVQQLLQQLSADFSVHHRGVSLKNRLIDGTTI